MSGEDREYVSWVRTRPCGAPSGACNGPIQAHHAGLDRGLSQRAHDRTCVPLCMSHHHDWHQGGGAFVTLTREDRRAWAREAIARTVASYREMPSWF